MDEETADGLHDEAVRALQPMLDRLQRSDAERNCCLEKEDDKLAEVEGREVAS